LFGRLEQEHLAADAGLAGVGRYGFGSKCERREVIMAPRSGAGLRDGVGRTERCANRDDLEILTLAGVAIAV
jgi:hypothetical protein